MYEMILLFVCLVTFESVDQFSWNVVLKFPAAGDNNMADAQACHQLVYLTVH
jgi:hypothetical protein